MRNQSRVFVATRFLVCVESSRSSFGPREPLESKLQCCAKSVRKQPTTRMLGKCLFLTACRRSKEKRHEGGAMSTATSMRRTTPKGSVRVRSASGARMRVGDLLACMNRTKIAHYQRTRPRMTYLLQRKQAYDGCHASRASLVPAHARIHTNS